MAIKLEDKTTYFELNGVPHPKDRARTVIHDSFVGLAEVGVKDINWVNPVIFSEWTDAGDTPYASRAALLTAIGTICFT